MAEPRFPPDRAPLSPYLRLFRRCVACGIYLSRERPENYCANRFCEEFAAAVERAAAMVREAPSD